MYEILIFVSGLLIGWGCCSKFTGIGSFVLEDEMINIITREQKIENVPKSWAEQYVGYVGCDKSKKREKLFELEAAGQLSQESINETIGNTSWTELRCDNCKKDKDALVRIGDEPDYDSRWQDLCLDCLGKAQKLLTQKEGSKDG